MSECTHDCSTCQQDCSERSMIEALHPMSRVGKVIGIVSGKGGVGKSMITAQLAVEMCRRGHKVGIMDGDITGPSIPKAFGLTEPAQGNEVGIIPVQTEMGIDVISMNLLLENETDPVVWRGPVIAGAVRQFWTDVIWSDEDYLFVDMPPGTGDVPLTVFQSIPLDGIIIVTSPQELVSMIVSKALNMAQLMNIPILGIVENMSYFECPDCGKRTSIFGESHIDEIASANGLKVLDKVPIVPEIAALVDAGKIETVDGHWLDGAADAVENI